VSEPSQAAPRPGRPPRRPPISLRDARTRSVLWQAVAVAIACAIIVLVGIQTAANLKQRGITSGFDYLGRAAGFELPPGPVPYASRDSYARALVLGLANTLRVSLLGILIATALGVAIGVARLSTIWVFATISRLYVELVRNTPLMLQLLFWYALSQALPGPKEALNPLPGVYLCIRGLFLPGLVWHGIHPWVGGGMLGVGVLVPVALAITSDRWETAADESRARRLLAGGAVALVCVAVVLGSGFSVERPSLAVFNFRGGLSVSPEFAALLIGLSTYTAAFIAEIVRGGIVAVGRGQKEAAAALGLSRGRALRLVVLPQALRVIIPPTTSQFLNLAKNSSLAVAIGYSDVMSVTDATLNQTGQAVEAIALAICVYLGMNLIISFAMNLYNARVAAGPAWSQHA